jgi:hypothetical protein
MHSFEKGMGKESRCAFFPAEKKLTGYLTKMLTKVADK